jgi:ribonuclease E
MLDRLWLYVALAATSTPGLACDVSEAAPSLPAPARRDAGTAADAGVVDAPATDASMDAAPPRDAGADARPLIDGGVRVRRPRPPRDAGMVDAGVPPVDAGAPSVDAAVADAAMADAGLADAAIADAAIVDAREPDAHDILRDSGEAPPLNDASILGRL